ncbi:MAG: hypothetical protein ABFR97_02270 [Thermodesulfobacteriota bacterium]
MFSLNKKSRSPATFRRSLTGLILGSGLLATPVWAADLGDVKVHGFASQGFILTKSNNYLASGTQGDGSWAFNELAVNGSWQATNSLRLGGQLMSRRFGGDGHNELYIDWAVVDYRLGDPLGLQLGKFKIPVGFYNQTRDIDLARVNVFLPQSIYPEAFRPFFGSGTGALAYGTLGLRELGSLEYELFYGKAEEDNDSCMVRSLEIMLQGTEMNMDANQVFGGALRYNTPLDGLRVGYTMAKGDADFDYINSYGLRSYISGGAEPGHVFSTEYSRDDLTISGEWMRTEMSLDSIYATPGGNLTRHTSTEAEGYYINASYIVTDWLEMSLQYEVYYRNRDDKDGHLPKNPMDPSLGLMDHGAWQKAWALAARFDVTDFWLIKLEGQYIDGTALLSPVYNEERDCERYWNMLAIKTTLFF